MSDGACRAPVGADPLRPGARSNAGILQLHASRRCNLTCLHCYSGAGPKERGSLALSRLERLFAAAVEEGYGILSISGGEPLIDPALFDQVALGRHAGLRVQLVTNATRADAATAQRLAETVDRVAVSIDGPPDVHNALRQSPAAFRRAVGGARALRDAGIPVGFIHTARMETLGCLRWLLEFAEAEGAAFVQLYPIEPIGRASETAGGVDGDAGLATRLMLLAAIVSTAHVDLPLQVDVLPVAALREPGDITARDAATTTGLLAAAIDPLVVEPDGAMVPWTYGIRRNLALGSILAGDPAEAMTEYRSVGLRAALAHAAATRTKILAGNPLPYVNWFAALAGG